MIIANQMEAAICKDAEAEVPVLWPPDAKSRLTGKDLGTGKDGGQEEKGAAEDGMVSWHL